MSAEGMTFTPMPRKSSCTTVPVSTETVAVSAAEAAEADPATASAAITPPTVVRLSSGAAGGRVSSRLHLR